MPWDVFRRAQGAEAPDEKLLYDNEDVLGTMTTREKGAEWPLAIDNRNMAGTNISCLTSQMPQGHLPMLLCPNPQTAYVLGFGGGTTHAIATYPKIQRIDASELSRSVIALRYRRPDVAVQKWSQAVQIDPANYEARTILEQFSRMLPANLAPDTP